MKEAKKGKGREIELLKGEKGPKRRKEERRGRSEKRIILNGGKKEGRKGVEG